MCGAAEVVSDLQSVWGALPPEQVSDGRLSSFLKNLLAENLPLFRSESALLCDWLVSLGSGYEETIRLLQSESSLAFSTPTLPGVGFPAVDLLSVNAEIIAEQLTLIDQHHLSSVRLSDLIAWARNDKSSAALAHFTSRFNHLSEFVQFHLISGSDFASRNKRLRFWVEVHKQLFNLNNFNSSLALFASFSSVPVQKLVKHGLLEFSRSQRRWLEFFDEMVNKQNRSQYRKKIMDLVRARESGIPFLGLALSDLVFIQDGNPDYVDEGNGRLFNMWKKYQVAKVIHYVHHFKRTKHSALKKDSDLFAFLSSCKSDLAAKQIDELVASIVSASQQSAAVAAVAVASSVPQLVVQSSTESATAPEEKLDGRFLSLIDSPDFSRGIKQKRSISKKKRVEEWNEWIESYVENPDAFARRLATSSQVEEFVEELLRTPMDVSERPVVETVLVSFALPGVKVELLADLLYSVAITEPNKAIRDLVVSIFLALKVLLRKDCFFLFYLWSFFVFQKVTPLDSKPVAANVVQLCEANKAFLEEALGVSEKVASLLGAPCLCQQLTEAIASLQGEN